MITQVFFGIVMLGLLVAIVAGDIIESRRCIKKKKAGAK